MPPLSQSTARPPVGGVVSVDMPGNLADFVDRLGHASRAAKRRQRRQGAVLPDERAIACIPDNLAGFIDVIGVCALDLWIEDSEIGDCIRAGGCGGPRWKRDDRRK